MLLPMAATHAGVAGCPLATCTSMRTENASRREHLVQNGWIVSQLVNTRASVHFKKQSHLHFTSAWEADWTKPQSSEMIAAAKTMQRWRWQQRSRAHERAHTRESGQSVCKPASYRKALPAFTYCITQLVWRSFRQQLCRALVHETSNCRARGPSRLKLAQQPRDRAARHVIPTCCRH